MDTRSFDNNNLSVSIAERTFPVSPAVYGDGDKASDRDGREFLGSSMSISFSFSSFFVNNIFFSFQEGDCSHVCISLAFCSAR